MVRLDALVSGARARLVLADTALLADLARLVALLQHSVHTLLPLGLRAHGLALVGHRPALVVTYVHGAALHRQQRDAQLQTSQRTAANKSKYSCKQVKIQLQTSQRTAATSQRTAATKSTYSCNQVNAQLKLNKRTAKRLHHSCVALSVQLPLLVVEQIRFICDASIQALTAPTLSVIYMHVPVSVPRIWTYTYDCPFYLYMYPCLYQQLDLYAHVIMC